MNLMTLLFAAIMAMAWITTGCQTGGEQINQEEKLSIEDSVSEADDFGEIDESVQLSLQTMLQPYYRLKDALVDADSIAAQRYAGQIAGIIFTFDTSTLTTEQQVFYKKHIDNVSIAVQEIQGTTSLAGQRMSFEKLSGNLYELLKKFKATDGNVYRMFCAETFSNKGAYWLSNNDEAKNPYSGGTNSDCGTVAETF